MKKLLLTLFAAGACLCNFQAKADTCTIYAYNNTGWDTMNLYMWGDVDHLGGSWPGINASDQTHTVNGYNFLVYTFESDLGKTEHLQFNNGTDTGKSEYYPYSTSTTPAYFEVNISGATLISNPSNFTPSAKEEAKQALVYLYDAATGKESPDFLNLYLWGQNPDWNNGWPGAYPSGVKIFNGVPFIEYSIDYYSTTPTSVNSIVTNKGRVGDTGEGNWQADGPYFTLSETPIYLQLSSSLQISSIDDINSFSGTQTIPQNLYIMGNLSGSNWDPENALAFTNDSNNIFTIEGVTLVTVDGNTESYFGFTNLQTSDWDALNDGTHRYGPVSSGMGVEAGSSAYTLINVSDSSWAIEPGTYDITVDFNSMTMSIEASQEQLPQPEPINGIVYVYNNTDWETVYMYMYGEVDDLGGGWPGIESTSVVTINGNEFLVFEYTAQAGLSENIIFNNNNAQLGDYAYTTSATPIYLEISQAGVTPISDPSNFTPGVVPDPNVYNLYVYNSTSWKDVYAYIYISATEVLSAAWPGDPSEGVKQVNNLDFNIYTFEAYPAMKPNVIFNNGLDGEGNQLEDLTITLTDNLDIYVEITPEKASIIDPATFKPGAIGSLIDAAAGEVEYFNLQGQRVANPQSGLYIIRQGDKARKVIVR